MALVVNTNVASLTSQKYVSESRSAMETAMERLSSGKQINSAADDAAGAAISTRMDSQIRGLSKAVQNANDGISLAQTAEGAQKEITEMLQRMRELALQSSNSTMNATDRASLDAEVQQLKDEIDAIAENTTFNNQKLIDGSFEAKLQIGDQVGKSMEFSLASMKLSDLGLGSNSTGTANTLIGSRVSFTDLSNVAEGDIEINGQAVGDLSAADDILDVVNVINDTIDNVEATGFNSIVMKNAGDGVSSYGDVEITVTPVNETDGTAGTDLVFAIDASNSLEELRDNINEVAYAVVTASINDDGKLVLSNDTGAAIKVSDTTTDGAATGLGTGETVSATTTAANETTFNGFIQLTATDDAAIRIERGNQEGTVGTYDDLTTLGFRQIGADNANTQNYSVLGSSFDATQESTAFTANNLVINGVDVYDEDIDTTSFGGKVESINAVSDQTGVTASAYFEQFYDMTDAGLTTTSAGPITINGHATDTGSSVADLVANINGLTSETGLTAELKGTGVIKLSGAVQSVTISHTTTTAAVAGFGAGEAFATGTTYGALKLESTNGTPIAIDLGQDAAAGTTKFGLLETNVGAADFDINDPFVGGSVGASVAGVNILSAASATAAIEAIDRAIQNVSDSSSKLGAIQNRLDHSVANLQETIVNTSASQSRILDTDFASESAQLAKQQVLQQASTAMLAQANASSQSVLTLLGG